MKSLENSCVCVVLHLYAIPEEKSWDLCMCVSFGWLDIAYMCAIIPRRVDSVDSY